MKVEEAREAVETLKKELQAVKNEIVKNKEEVKTAQNIVKNRNKNEVVVDDAHNSDDEELEDNVLQAQKCIADQKERHQNKTTLKEQLKVAEAAYSSKCENEGWFGFIWRRIKDFFMNIMPASVQSLFTDAKNFTNGFVGGDKKTGTGAGTQQPENSTLLGQHFRKLASNAKEHVHATGLEIWDQTKDGAKAFVEEAANKALGAVADRIEKEPILKTVDEIAGKIKKTVESVSGIGDSVYTKKDGFLPSVPWKKLPQNMETIQEEAENLENSATLKP